MNRHFSDAWYHAKRTGSDVAMGVRMELDPVVRRAERLTGREHEPEPSRLDEVRHGMRRAERRAELTARRAADRARSRMRTN